MHPPTPSLEKYAPNIYEMKYSSTQHEKQGTISYTNPCPQGFYIELGKCVTHTRCLDEQCIGGSISLRAKCIIPISFQSRVEELYQVITCITSNPPSHPARYKDVPLSPFYSWASHPTPGQLDRTWHLSSHDVLAEAQTPLKITLPDLHQADHTLLAGNFWSLHVSHSDCFNNKNGAPCFDS